MSKRSRNAWIQLAVLALLGGAVILTLVLPQLSGNRTPDPPLELSVIIRESDSSLWGNARLGMEQAAAELRAETRFLVLSTDNDGQEQEDLLRREYEGGAGALVVVPAEPEKLAQDLRELTGKCPVVALESALEGVLFASGEPVPVERLCLGLEVDRPTLDAVAQRLMDKYSYERRGIRLVRLDTSYQLCSAPEFAPYIRKTLESRKPARLSQPALEVLAIIAYYQPVTRAYVDQVRGVDSAYTVGLLLERELIEEAGRLAVPGRPTLFRTTKNFLRSFGLTNLEELPELPDASKEGEQLTLELEAAVEKLKTREEEQRADSPEEPSQPQPESPAGEE